MPRTRRPLTHIALAVVALAAYLGAAAAATLGGLSDGQIGVWAQEVQACDDEIELHFDSGHTDKAEVSGIADECVGKNLRIALLDGNGQVLAQGTIVISGSGGQITFGDEVDVGDVDWVAATIGAKPVDVVMSGGGPITDCLNCTYQIIFDSDQYAQYCAKARITGTNGTAQNPVEWRAVVDMREYPLKGTLTGAGTLHAPYIAYTLDDGILTFWGLPQVNQWWGTTYVGKQLDVNWCAVRDIPGDGNIWEVGQMVSDWGGGYCYRFSIYTDEPQGVEWSWDFDLAQPPFNDIPPYTVTPSQMTYATNGSIITVRGVNGVWGTQYTFPDKPALNMQFCGVR